MEERKGTPREAEMSRDEAAARRTISLERSMLLGVGDRTTAAKIGDKGGGGGGAPNRHSQ